MQYLNLSRFIEIAAEPFGGVNVLACGDLFQLPPVVQSHEESQIYSKYDSVYFFDALSFKEIENPTFFELTKSFRQEEDDIFYELLNNVRLGINLEDTINRINKHCHDPTLEVEPFMTLTSRKNRAEDINLHKLSHNDNEEEVIPSKEKGELKENDLPAPRELKIKKDAKLCLSKMIVRAGGLMAL